MKQDLRWTTDSSGVMRAEGHEITYKIVSYKVNSVPVRWHLFVDWDTDPDHGFDEYDAYKSVDSCKKTAESHHAHICSLLEKAKPQWIPCEEHRPACDERVWVSSINKLGQRLKATERRYMPSHTNPWGVCDGETATHWQPLPPAPTPQQKGE